MKVEMFDFVCGGQWRFRFLTDEFGIVPVTYSRFDGQKYVDDAVPSESIWYAPVWVYDNFDSVEGRVKVMVLDTEKKKCFDSVVKEGEYLFSDFVLSVSEVEKDTVYEFKKYNHVYEEFVKDRVARSLCDLDLSGFMNLIGKQVLKGIGLRV